MDELMTYLQEIDGGLAFAGTNEFDPNIHFVLAGQYYGFYTPRGNRRLNRRQQAIKAKLVDAGGIVATVRCTGDLDRILARDERRYRLHQAMPAREMRRMLDEWGKGSYRLNWLDALIKRLPSDARRVIMARYMDNVPCDEIAREMYYCERQVYRFLTTGVDQLIEWAVDGTPEPHYVEPGWVD